MHRLNELVARLTPAQVKEVEDFAEFLLSRGGAIRPEEAARDTAGGSGKICFEGWAGCLAHVDKSGVELAHEATELRATWAEPKE